jgi:hypothetical protein
MKKIFFVALVILSACSKSAPQPTPSIKAPPIAEVQMNNLNLLPPENPHDKNTQIPVSIEQVTNLKLILKSMTRVISLESKLSQEENFLGAGKDHYPKGPGPILYRFYDKEISKGNGISIPFKRQSGNDPWFKSNIEVSPKNFPRGVYKMHLQSDFFEDFVLIKSYLEEHPEFPQRQIHSMARENVFEFSVKGSAQKVVLTVRAREDVSNLKDGYPKSFHELEIVRHDQ